MLLTFLKHIIYKWNFKLLSNNIRMVTKIKKMKKKKTLEIIKDIRRSKNYLI